MPTSDQIQRYRELLREVADSEFMEANLSRAEIKQILEAVNITPYTFAEAVRRLRERTERRIYL